VAKRSIYKIKALKTRGHKVVTYSVGAGDEAVFLLNGGPGLPCDYLRDPHAILAEHGYHVVTYDQLGCGASDNPKDMSLWTIGGYAAEVESVRQQLGLGKVHLLGHSWGGWLAIEYALTYPDSLKSLILADTCGDMPHLVSELNRLRGALGSETEAMMLRHEAEGTLDHPEYQAAVTILNYRHVCRLSTYPESLNKSLKHWNMTVYGHMQGPNEFLYTGNLKDWNRIPDMHKIRQPTLVIAGQHDELTPACALRMHQVLPRSRIKIFPNSSHTPFYEEPAAYFPVLLDFLEQQRAKSGRGKKASTSRPAKARSA
jgi:proline iminopeptidase